MKKTSTWAAALALGSAAVVASAFAASGSSNAATPSATRSSMANPLAAHALPSGERFRFDAEVEDRLDAGTYVYLRVRDQAGHAHWVASMRAFTPGASSVAVWVMARAAHFHSPRLQRDFDPLLFAAVRAR